MKIILLNLGRGSVVRAQLCPSAPPATTRSLRSRANLWLMRISLAYSILIASSIQLLARSTNGQTIDKELVTIELQNDNLVAMVKKIEAQSTLRFIYLPEQLSKYGSVTLSKGKRTIRETLELALIGTGLAYEESGKYVVLKDVREVASSRSVVPQPVLDASLVKGKVTDEDGQGIAGVNIIVKGTTTGTTTDVSGDYALVAEASDVLVFSFIGYKTQEVNVAGRTTVDVGLEADVAALKEVQVNAGYWTVNDTELVGNIAKVSSKDIQKQPVSNPLAALQGRVPGLEIIQQTGVPGGNFTVRIRGQNSIGKGNDPLYIVDGVPFVSNSLSSTYTSGAILALGVSPLNYINPNDIESIEVLKDADATAIYGSRGANGVILITTKKKVQSAANITAGFYSGVGQANTKLKMMSTPDYLAMRQEAFANDSTTPTLADAPDLLVWSADRYTDWKKSLIGGTARITDAQITISSGEANTQFSFGTNYHKETTVFPGDNFDRRIATHFTLTNLAFNKRLKTDISINYSILNTNLLTKDLTFQALSYAPNAPSLYDEKGELNWDATIWNGANPHPLSYTRQSYESATNNLVGNIAIDYSIVNNLNARISFGYTNTSNTSLSTYPISSLYPKLAFLENSSTFSNGSFRNNIIEPQLSWKKQISRGVLNTLIGGTFLHQITEGGAQFALGFASEALMKVPSAAANAYNMSGSYAVYKYAAIFGRLNYVLSEKYIINVTGRRDGSSRFGPGQKFANFGAVGLGWLFSRERFLNFSFLSFGKLRASYGVSGNDQLGDYEYLDSYISNGSYRNVSTLTPARLSNPNFSWETNRKMEVGLDLGFFGDRITAGVSYYRNRSSNQLVDLPLPPNTGFTSIQSNFPATVQNSGFEVVLNTLNITVGKFSWRTSLNTSVPRNKLIKFPGLSESTQYNDLLVIGKPVNILKGYHFAGVDSQTGLYQFVDENEDGRFDYHDRNSVRFIGQNFSGGIQNSFQIGGFQVDFLFQFVKQTGRDIMAAAWAVPGAMFNQPISVSGRWQAAGDKVNIQRYGVSWPTTETYIRLSNSDRFVVDASYVRLKNLSISYALPVSVLDRVKLSSARIFLQGQNLLTFTKYKGVDPETQSTVLPPLRVLTAGINVGL